MATLEVSAQEMTVGTWQAMPMLEVSAPKMTVETGLAMPQERSALTAGGACEAGCQIRILPSISGKSEYRLSMQATPSHAGALALFVSNYYSNHHMTGMHVDETLVQLA